MKNDSATMFQFTDKILASLPLPYDRKSVEYTDNSDVIGLKLQVSHTGRKTFFLRYRGYDGRKRAFKVGLFPSTSVQEARQYGHRLLSLINSRGFDPQEERVRMKKARVAGDYSYHRHVADYAYMFSSSSC